MIGNSAFIAGCGALAGAGIFTLARALTAARPRLSADLAALYAAPARLTHWPVGEC